MRHLYSLLFYIALPFILARLWWRGQRQPEYKNKMLERVGFYSCGLKQSLWVHAVSMGEVIAAIPLIKELQATYPNFPVLVTTMTPTGAAQVKKAFGESVTHVYVPYDVPYAVHKFLKAMNPVMTIIMETELWPNLIAACGQRHIPVVLLNARLSERSAQGYKRIAHLTRHMLQSIQVIAAHSEKDAQRFLELGARNVQVTGSIKFDLQLPANLIEQGEQLRHSLGRERFVWIAASTHAGEEEIILAAHAKFSEKYPRALLILVPRHPERFKEIAELTAKQFKIARRSLGDAILPETNVYLGDTMGDLLLMYSAADVAFVAGSLINHGGHNLLEPAALAKPIIAGPYVFNFAEIAQLLIRGQALITVADAQSLVMALEQLQSESLSKQKGLAAQQVVMANRGALAKQLAVVKQLRVAPAANL